MRSLQSRILALQIFIFSMVILLMAYVVMRVQSIEERNTSTESLRLTQIIVSEQKQVFNETTQYLNLLGDYLQSHFFSNNEVNRKECSNFLETVLAKYSHYLNIGLIDRNGTVICSGLPLINGEWSGDRDYLQEVIKTGELAISNYMIDRNTGNASVNFGYPLFDSHGNVTNVLFLALDINRLSAHLDKSVLPRDTTITLLSKTGVILSRFPENNLIGTSAKKWPVFQTLLEHNSQGTVESRDFNGINRLYGFTSIDVGKRHLYILTGIPSQVAYSGIKEVYTYKFLIFLFLALIIGFLTWIWTHRNILIPLQVLRRTTLSLKQGDLNARSDFKFSSQEMADLAEKFDDMALSLEQRFREKITHEKNLELLNRALRTLSGGNHGMIRSEDEQSLLDEMCRVAVEEGEYAGAWVGLISKEHQNRLRFEASHGIDAKWMSDRNILEDSVFLPREHISYKVLASRTTHCNNIIAQNIKERFGSIIPFRRVEGILILPLKIDGDMIGVFTIYTENDAGFTEAEINVLEEMAEDLAFGIKTQRIRKQHEEAQRTINKLAFYDAITELANHTKLEQLLDDSLFSGTPRYDKAALLLIGLDRFRDINNTLGFETGNMVLNKVALRLKQESKDYGSLFRMRGDEFAVFIPGADGEMASIMAQNLIKELEPLYELPGFGFSLSVSSSIGIVLFPDHSDNKGKLLAAADIALQYAKQRSSGFEFFDPSIDTDKRKTLELASKLHRALLNNELTLYYQPKVSLTTGKVTGFEALSRWIPPSEKMIPPDVFINLAEKTGMIRSITHWVLETAFKQSYQWRQVGINLPIAVNLSARNLHEYHLLEFIKDLTTEWKIEAGAIEMELTEGAIMEDTEVAGQVLAGIRDLGIPLYIDDFGTGESSLKLLKQHPASTLKIDKSFVIPMLEDHESCSIVEASIELAHDLGITVVAEGVENEKIWESLKNLNCDYGQGYYMGKPMPAGEVETWLKTSEFGLNDRG